MILVDVVRSALAHLELDKCPRCLGGELVVDVARARFICTWGCADVASAVGECAARMTGALKGEGETLSMLCRRAQTESLDSQYMRACSASADLEAIVQKARAA